MNIGFNPIMALSMASEITGPEPLLKTNSVVAEVEDTSVS